MRDITDPLARFGSKADLDQEEIDRLRQEISNLKSRLEELERKNRVLKQRNYEITMRYSRNPLNRKHPMQLNFDVIKQDEKTKERNEELVRFNKAIQTDLDLNFVLDKETSLKVVNNNDVNTDLKYEGNLEAVNLDEDVETGSKDKVGEMNVLVEDDYFGENKSKKGDKSLESVETKTKAVQNLESNDVSSISETVSEDGKSRTADGGSSGGVDTVENINLEIKTVGNDGIVSSNWKQRHTSENARRKNKAQHFVVSGELVGHRGAVYSVEYSEHREWIASGSFDRTVRVWDTMESKQVACLEGHKMSVSTVAWQSSGEKPMLASGGFDGQILEWDLGGMQCVNVRKSKGLVQSVIYNKQNGSVIYSSGSSGDIEFNDMRGNTSSGVIGSCSGPVTSLVQLGENQILSSDLNGRVCLWDVRLLKTGNEGDNQILKLSSAISNISLALQERTGAAYLAVNSYDDVLRVYERINNANTGMGLDSGNNEVSGGSGFEGGNNSMYSYNIGPRLIKEIRGVANRNWPIRSAFLCEGVAETLLGKNSIMSDTAYAYDTRSRSTIQDDLKSGLMLATGSAEPYGYIHWISTAHKRSQKMWSEKNEPGEKSELGEKSEEAGEKGGEHDRDLWPQRLEGHSDRVYTVGTHKWKAQLCTGSADSTILIWQPSHYFRTIVSGYDLGQLDNT
ncbi:hypothetical protein BB559_007538 [Furculomyces boomerangus]|uniref:Striatin N-terminal domain-containing protein n=1 Tax=Furculomyces boomerangus TaxID=61424 RepID=A0A2T9XWZ3_9FUNG|nr:hypothetical protein BB559_007538 [Furculomyces boomerangus]